MGYIRHHAIVVTGHLWQGDPDRAVMIGDAHQAAKDAGCYVSDIVGPLINATASFLVAPDGSKEGWDESDKGDTARDTFIAWLRHKDNRGWFSWAEVVLGEDDGEAHVERHAWQPRSLYEAVGEG